MNNFRFLVLGSLPLTSVLFLTVFGLVGMAFVLTNDFLNKNPALHHWNFILETFALDQIMKPLFIHFSLTVE